MWERGKQVLGDIQGYVQVLDTLTLQSIKNWSKSGNIHLQTDLKALITGELKSGDSKSGVVCCLPEFKISEEERRRYTKALIDHQKKISPTRVKDRVEGEFESWRQWIEKRANEIEILIDTANCGFYMNGGEFSYFQANMMFSTLSKRYKVKLVLSQTRAKVEHGSPESKILDDWKSSESVYITPTGMNDDAFWMYGALWLSGLGKRILILSNDLLRDHHLNTSYDKGFFFFMTSHLMRFRGATNQHRKNKKRKIQCDSFSFFPPFPYSIQPHFLPSNQGILFPYMAESSSLLEKDLYKHTETDSTPALPETIANRIRWALLNLTSEPMKSTTNDSNKPNINTTTSTSSNNTSATSGSAKSLGKRKRDPGT
uniref:PRORP domain-containing protein n=1 Tax=Amorphochlora amoebiformis TaxID=1561963 RepID=A0A7S0DCR6_9EUKA